MDVDITGLERAVPEEVMREFEELLRELERVWAEEPGSWSTGRSGWIYQRFVPLFRRIYALIMRSPALRRWLRALVRSGEFEARFPTLTRLARYYRYLGTGVEAWEVVATLGIVLEVLFIVGVGLVLPASHMGDLTFNDEADREEWYQLIVRVYAEQARARAEFRAGTSSRTRTQLLEAADYLWRQAQAYLHRYPRDDNASVLRVIERAAGSWVRQALGWDEDGLTPDAPPPPPPGVASGGGSPRVPAEHPHTVERPRPPQTYDEWLKGQQQAEAERIRRRIIEVRARLREMKRKRADPNYGADGVQRVLDEYIKALLDELEKLRKQLAGMKDAIGPEADDTREDLDEPYDPPPPAPLPPWPLGHNWINPYRLYVNPRTGEQRWFSDPAPGGDWQRADDGVGRARYHWGWVPEPNPVSGKVEWRPGWVEGPPPEVRYQGTLMVAGGGAAQSP